MNMSATQLWNNIFAIIVVAIVIEVAVSSIFSIKYIDDIVQGVLSKSIKNFLVLLIAFGLCYHVSHLRIFYGSKMFIGSKILKSIHILLSTLVLARAANLIHDWFSHLKEKSRS